MERSERRQKFRGNFFRLGGRKKIPPYALRARKVKKENPTRMKIESDGGWGYVFFLRGRFFFCGGVIFCFEGDVFSQKTRNLLELHREICILRFCYPLPGYPGRSTQH